MNFLDVIKAKAKILRAKHVDNITSLDANLKFYLLKDKRDYVFAVKILDNISLEKIRYSLQGVVMSHVTHSISNDIVLRKSGAR